MTCWFLVRRTLPEGEAPLWPRRANNQRHCSTDLIKTNNHLPLTMFRRALSSSHYLLPFVLWELRTFCGSQIVPTCVLNNNLFLWKKAFHLTQPATSSIFVNINSRITLLMSSLCSGRSSPKLYTGSSTEARKITQRLRPPIYWGCENNFSINCFLSSANKVSLRRRHHRDRAGACS